MRQIAPKFERQHCQRSGVAQDGRLSAFLARA
jgi:hypothetical protein